MSFESVYKTFGSSTVTVFNLSTRDVYGTPTYATGVSFLARVAEVNRMVPAASGQNEVLTHRIWILSTSTAQTAVTIQSAVALGGDSTTERRRVISVERPPDRSGLHHTVINLGV